MEVARTCMGLHGVQQHKFATITYKIYMMRSMHLKTHQSQEDKKMTNMHAQALHAVTLLK